MFKTDMASNAFERIYEILEVDKLLSRVGLSKYSEEKDSAFNSLSELLVQYGLYRNLKDDPSAVRQPTEDRINIVNRLLHLLQQEMDTQEDDITNSRIDLVEKLREILDEEIAMWLVSVIGQERGETDVWKLNDFYGSVFEERGTLDRAFSVARSRYSYYKKTAMA